MGVVTPIGIGKEAFFTSLEEGTSAGVRLDQVEPDPQNYFPLDLESSCKVGAGVLDFDPEPYMSSKKIRRLSRPDQFSVVSSFLALQDGGIPFEEVEEDQYVLPDQDPERVGVLMGANLGGLSCLEENYERFLEKGPRKVSAYIVPQMMTNSAAGTVSIFFGLEGFSVVSSSACASSTHAMALATSLIRENRADMVLAGGTEAALTPFMIAAFARIRAITERNDDPSRACRPFDAERDGFLPSEGAGVVLLETLEHARERGAEPYAEIRGAGMTDDAYHVTAPTPSGDGARESMRLALEEAELDPGDVDYINAHGTSTPQNDVMETRAIKSLFGDHAYDLAISSTKSQMGHLLGGAGVAEAVATIYAITHGRIPPTINYENPDPECDLNYTPNETSERPVDVAISNSFGFGGHNGTLCFTSLNGGAT